MWIDRRRWELLCARVDKLERITAIGVDSGRSNASLEGVLLPGAFGVHYQLSINEVVSALAVAANLRFLGGRPPHLAFIKESSE